MRSLGVCLIGPGRVGTATILALPPGGGQLTLRSVVTRRFTPGLLAAGAHVTTDGATAVTARDVDVVIDTSSDPHSAHPLLLAAVRAGKIAVTASKALALTHGLALEAEARESGGAFGYDAAVCAALPVTSVIREHCASDQILEIDGLFSGTCNYVLSAMDSRGLSFDDAVTEAQRLGYAEPDPTDDLNGLDAARKTALIAQLATGRPVPLESVTRVGIDALDLSDLKRLAERGQRLRLVSRIRPTGTDASAFVAPLPVADGHLFAEARDVENVLRVRSEGLGTIVVTGAGAGVTATAAALLADVRRHAVRHGSDPGPLRRRHSRHRR